MTGARARLAALLGDPAIDPPLDLGAALLAEDEQLGASSEDMVASLDELARGLFLPEGADLFQSVARLNHHLFRERGFSGENTDFDDPASSYLNHVISRRRGLPILLSVLYIEVARRVGFTVLGVGFPGHFIVSPSEADPRFFIDAFAGGRILRPEQLEARLERLAGRPVTPAELSSALQPSSNRAILVRMNVNLKGAFFRRGDMAGTLRAVERLALLEPANPGHLRDRGWLTVQLGDAPRGVAMLERYLSENPNASDVDQIQAEVRALKPVG